MGYITKTASGAVISLFPEAVSYATAPIRFLISSGDALLLISRVIPLILRIAPELFSELPSVLIDCCFVGATTDSCVFAGIFSPLARHSEMIAASLTTH